MLFFADLELLLIKMWNDPLGALSKANAALKEKAAKTAESIKNNENLK